MKTIRIILLLFCAIIFASSAYGAVTASQILGRVKAAETNFQDLKADLVITDSNRSTIEGMGEGYEKILKLKKAVLSFKKPNLFRYDGYAEGIKAVYIQNGYVKQFTASMIKHKENVKNAPGKRQDTLDLGFLSSQLWVDNTITVSGTEKGGIIKLKLVPKFGDRDKRHDLVWIDPKTLRILKREKYRGSGEMRVRMIYSDFKTLTSGLPIATRSQLYNKDGKELGTVEYKNIKVNTGLSNSLFEIK